MTDTIRKTFAALYGRAPEVVAYAPGRIEFIGNHTDYNGGPVLGAAINRGTWVALARREDGQRQLASDWQAGSARFAGPRCMTAEQRVEFVDGPFSQGWFRTVTRETWDDNNFLPSDYAADPVLGLRLWRQAARPDLHVWIRYLLEYHASDIRTEHGATRTPVLLLHPGLEGAWREPTGDYLTAFTRAGWGDLAGTGIEARTIPGARLVPWVDQLAPVVTEIRRFSGASPGVADRRPGQ